MENEKDYTEIDLVEVFHVILDNARNIFVVMLCCVVLAAVYLVIKPPAPLPEEAPWETRYRSYAQVRIKVVTNMANFNLSQKISTYNHVLVSKPVIQPIFDKLEIEKPIGDRGISWVKDTEMANLSFDASEPEVAQQGATLLLQTLRDYIARNEQIDMKYSANKPANSATPGGEEEVLFQRVECEIINPPDLPKKPVAKPKPQEDPKKPKPTPPSAVIKRTITVSLLLGFLLGSGYAVMHYLMNRKITTRQDVEDYLGLPVLAVVPEEKSLAEAMTRKNDQSVLQKIGGLLWKEQN